jgi:hypothetical protein
MNKKFTTLKRTIKHRTPEIIVGVIVVAGAITLKHLATSSNETDEMPEGVVLPYEWLDVLNEHGGAYLMQLSKGDFLVT